MAAEIRTQNAPSLSSFGLADGGKPFPTETDANARQMSRTVAVGKRGAGQSKGGNQELDSSTGSGEGEDLDAPVAGEHEFEESFEREASSTASEEAAAERAEAEAEGEGKPTDDSREDKRTRRQLREALAKQAEEMSALQRRQDAVEARQTQAQATQTQAAERPAADEDAEVTGILDDGKSDTELLSRADIKVLSDRRKKLDAYVGKQATKQVRQFAESELNALYALPGAKEVVEWAQKNGELAKVATHSYTATKVFALLQAKHAADTKGLQLQIGKLKEQVRRLNLGEVPPSGQGSRGGHGTGQGFDNGRSLNPMVKGWERLKSEILQS